jgi:Tol biopolymer transport system component
MKISFSLGLTAAVTAFGLSPIASASGGSGLTSLSEARNNEFSVSTTAGVVAVNCATDLSSKHAVSHDGQRRVFVRHCASSGGEFVESYVIVQDQRRTVTAQIGTTSEGKPQIDASISDDGNWVVYTLRMLDSGESQINLVQLADWSDDDPSSARVSDVQIDLALHDGHIVMSEHPFVSADGKYVVFDSSSGTNKSTQGVSDIYLYTAATKKLTKITSNTDGSSSNPSISADGTRVAFVSTATNLIDADTNGWDDIYVWDSRAPLASPKFVRASQGSATPSGGADAPSSDAMISANGGYVVYSSFANDLAPIFSGASFVKENVYVYDIAVAESYLVNSPDADSPGCHDSPGTQISSSLGPMCVFNYGPNSSWSPVISADGRYIAFVTELPDLIPTWSDAYGEWLPGETIPPGWQPDIQPRVLLRDMSEGRFYLQSARAIHDDALSRDIPGWYTTARGSSACMNMYGKPPLALSLSADGQSTVFEVSDQASHCAVQSSSFTSYRTPDPDKTWSVFLKTGKGPRTNSDPFP